MNPGSQIVKENRKLRDPKYICQLFQKELFRFQKLRA